jgi:hypothetical protein
VHRRGDWYVKCEAERVSPAVRDVVPLTPVSENGVQAYALSAVSRLRSRDEHDPQYN